MGRRRAEDFERVQETREEVAAYIRKYNRTPAMYRVQCKGCGRRIWGSGIGIGSHRRACTAGPSAWAQRLREEYEAFMRHSAEIVEAQDKALMESAKAQYVPLERVIQRTFHQYPDSYSHADQN